jgi:DNA-directed RNA polymerase specialized sigma subunit
VSFANERNENATLGDPQDETQATRILLSLSDIDRDVISRFYLDHQAAVDIERHLGLEEGYVNQLKASVRRSFLEAAGPGRETDE